MAVWLDAGTGGVTLRIYVQPRASRNQLTGVQGEELKVRLTSPPVDGAANRTCCEYFARLFGVPKSAVDLVSGESSRHKRLRVAGVGAAEAEAAVAAELQR